MCSTAALMPGALPPFSSTLAPIFDRLRESARVESLDRRIDELTGRLAKRFRASIAIAVRSDELRMASYDSVFHLDGVSFQTCPEINRSRYPAGWQANRRSLWNHCFQARPTQSPRRFLERFALPDAASNEWAADSSYAHMLNLPFVLGGRVFGKLLFLTERRFSDGSAHGVEAGGLMASLAPLWLYRNLLGDLASFPERSPFSLAQDRRREAAAAVLRAGLLEEPRLLAALPAAARSELADLRAALGRVRPGRAAIPSARVLIGPADAGMQRGIAALLHDQDETAEIPAEVIGLCDTPADTMALARRVRPDVLVLDGGRPGAFEFIHRLRSRRPETRLLVLLDATEEIATAHLGDAGVAGCVMKSDLGIELAPAIAALKRGRSFYGAGVREHVGARLGLRSLTAAERAVLRDVRAGRTNREIAGLCHVSVDTVKLRLKNAFQKLGARSRVEAVDIAVRTRLI